ncbi:MAG: hypothetical protein ACLGG9_08035 [Thermoleophilia bacterium]|jgi:hypothetical protein
MERRPLTLTLLALDRDAREDLLSAMPDLEPDTDAAALTLAELIDLGPDARPAVGEMDGWTLLVDTLFAVPDPAEVVHRATRGRSGYAFLWQAASGSHGFGAHHDGAGYRSAFRSQDAWLIDQGEALPEETGLDWDADPEGSLAELASRLTGLDVADAGIWGILLTPLKRAPRRSKTGRAPGR